MALNKAMLQQNLTIQNRLTVAIKRPRLFPLLMLILQIRIGGYKWKMVHVKYVFLITVKIHVYICLSAAGRVRGIEYLSKKGHIQLKETLSLM